MIIIISGEQGAGKTRFANALAESMLPPEPIVAELPNKSTELSNDSDIKIFTHQRGKKIPNWVIKRNDCAVIHLETFLKAAKLS